MILTKVSSFKYWPQIAALSLLVLAYGAYWYFAYYDTRSSDAYVSAHVVNMAALVSGPIIDVYVNENQKVKKGDKLFKVDPRPYQFSVQLAKSRLSAAQNTQNSTELSDAQAALDQANYLLEHTILTAPEDGYVTNFNLRVGQYIKAGLNLFAFIETKDWWVITRYRETAIRLIKPGDKAEIKIDMYPGKVFHGHVKSIGWGINRAQSGDSAPSTLVYLEATEDWIQIAQRFPVHISIDDLSDEFPMRIGASATTITYR